MKNLIIIAEDDEKEISKDYDPAMQRETKEQACK